MKAVAELVPCGHTAADVGCDHGFVSIYLAQHDICPRVFAGDVRKSNRMKAVAELVPCGHTAADVGCDHGFVSIYLAQHDICPRVFAGDVRKGPLDRAKEHIRESGLSDRITAVLSDGLKNIPVAGKEEHGEICGADGFGPLDRAKEHIRESGLSDRITAVLSDGLKNIPVAGKEEHGEICGADGFIAAGMGGKLIVQILTDVPEKTEALKWCVLSPQSEIWLVRQKLTELGFLILRENMVLEDGKYYPVPEKTEALKWCVLSPQSEIWLVRQKLTELGFLILRENMVLEDGKYYPMMLAVREAEAEWSNEAADVRKKNSVLFGRMSAAGFTEEERERAADWLGARLIEEGNAVLISFLGHIMSTDELLLAGMPETAASGKEDGLVEDTVLEAKQERIALRRREIERRMELSGKVLGFLMPETAASGKEDGLVEDTVLEAKQERIALRRREIERRMELSGKVLGFLGKE